MKKAIYSVLLIMILAMLPISSAFAEDVEEGVTDEEVTITVIPPIEDTLIVDAADATEDWMLPSSTETGTWYYSPVYEQWYFVEGDVKAAEPTPTPEIVYVTETVTETVTEEIDINKLAEALAKANASMQVDCEHKWTYNETTGIYMCTLCGAITQTAPGTGDVEEIDTKTFFGNLFEYCKEHASNILSIISTLLLVGYGIAVKFKAIPLANAVVSNIKAAKKDTTDTAESQNKVVGAVNGMVDVSNATVERLNTIEKDYAELVAQNKTITTLCVSIFEAYNLAQTNNKNLPQGVKDVLNSKYAQALNMLGNDDNIAKIVNTVNTVTDVVKEIKDEVSAESVVTEV